MRNLTFPKLGPPNPFSRIMVGSPCPSQYICNICPLTSNIFSNDVGNGVDVGVGVGKGVGVFFFAKLLHAASRLRITTMDTARNSFGFMLTSYEKKAY
jgi:hypothetical protein